MADDCLAAGAVFVNGETGFKITDVPKMCTPIDNLVHCEVIPPPEMTNNGLFLPQQQQRSYVSPRFWVIAVGPCCKWVKAGDQIVVQNSAHMGLIRMRGYEFQVFNENAIAGVIDPPEGGWNHENA